jgi:hypothetical protein
MSYKLGLNCYLIEPAEKFLLLLSKPISTILNSADTRYNLHSKWTYYFIELYNNRLEFLLMGETRVNGRITETSRVFKKNYRENYDAMCLNFERLNNLEIWEDLNTLNDDHIVLSLDQKKTSTRNRLSQDCSTLIHVNKSIDNENMNKIILENTMLRLVVFIYQYINKFEEDSININLWNYSLRSMTFSPRCFFVGLCTLFCQYIWTIVLLYSVIIDFDLSDDPVIILISIVSTIVSMLYSYNTISSYRYASPLYKFLLKMYTDYPDLILNHDEKNNIFYKKKTITMKKWHIRYNWWADFFSNFILPLCIPIINIFVIANSDNIVDAILNSVAIFFIIQIDEDLLSITSYENEKNTINFIRWITGVVYCNHFPLFKDIFKLEYDSWCSNAFNVSKKFRRTNKVSSEIVNSEIVINDTGSSEIDEAIFERRPTLRKNDLPSLKGRFGGNDFKD